MLVGDATQTNAESIKTQPFTMAGVVQPIILWLGLFETTPLRYAPRVAHG
jgi:hypothetical protein